MSSQQQLFQLNPLTAACLLLSAATTPMAVAQSGLVLEEVIVTAQKREQSLQDVPVSVTAINAKAIEQLGIQTTADVVRIAPSLTIVESNNKTNSAFSIRGIGTNVFGIGVEQAVAMIIDDVAMTQQGQSMENLLDIERIEVLRGPQSTLFGKAASAGVISIVTKAPSEEFEGTIEASWTDENEERLTGNVSGPLSDTVGYRLSGYWLDRDGYSDNVAEGFDDLNGEDGYGLRGKLHWDISDTLTATLGAYYDDVDSDCCGRGMRFVEDGAQLLGFVPEDFLNGIQPSEDNTDINQDTLPNSSTESWGTNVRFSWDFNDFNLLSITAYDEWEYTNDEDVDFSDIDVLFYLSGGAESGGLFSNAWRDSDFFSQEFRLTSPIYDNYDYLVGLYYADGDIDRSFFRNLTIAPADWAGSGGTTNAAIFGQFNYRFTDKFSSSLGLRYFNEEIRSEFEDFTITDPKVEATDNDDDVVGKISFQYDISDNMMAFTSYTRGYKGQAYDITIGFNEEKAQDPVSPEISDSYELGLKSTLWDQRLQLNLVAFYTEYDDFQVQASKINDDGVFEVRLDNAGELVTQGVELETVTLLSEELTLTFNAAYVDSEVNDYIGANCYPGQTVEEGCIDATQDVDGGTLPNSPEWKYTAMLDYRKALNGVSFDFFANAIYTWQDEVLFGVQQSPLTYQDSYGVTNFRAGITDKNDRYEITAFVNNVFDEDYVSDIADGRQLYAGSVVLFHVVPRNSQQYWGIKARYNF